jgi:Zn-dependent protease
MVPGFPLDGGRVLRAIWWLKTGDIKKSTRLASRIGKGFAFFLIILGFMQIFVGNFTGGLWFILIGVFLQQAAEGSYRQLIMKMALEGRSKGTLPSPRPSRNIF